MNRNLWLFFLTYITELSNLLKWLYKFSCRLTVALVVADTQH